MNAAYHFKLLDNHLWLSPDRMVFWEEEKAIIVSDLHFGKSGHFRKSGIAIPQNVYKEDLQRLVNQLQHYQPKKLIVAGDMFHSHANKELEWFKRWRDDFDELEILLIKGNHDILHDRWYADMGIETSDSLLLREFFFTHDIEPCMDKLQSGTYCFSGHIHPGVRVRGGGRQVLSLPCYYFTRDFCVLPAFSRFTGVAIIEPVEGDNVFAIVNNTIIPFGC